MNIEKIYKVSDEVMDGFKAIHNNPEFNLSYKEGDIFILAKERDLILGYTHLRFSSSHLLALYVLDGYIKNERKVGSTLLLEAIKEFRVKNTSLIQVGIEPFNKEVIPFYEKYGFKYFSTGKTGFTSLVFKIS